MKKLFIVLFVMLNSIAFSQTVLYNEPFTGQLNKGAIGPATTDVVGITSWSITTDFTGLTANSDWFKVVDDGTGNLYFQARDVDVLQIWQTSVVNITGYSNITIQMDLYQGTGLDPTDNVNIYYVLDGGFETLIATYAGAFPSPTAVNFSGLSGSTLQVIIKILNNAGTEKYSFDNVKIIGDNTTTSDVTNLASTPGNANGSLTWTTPTGCSDEILVIASTASVTTTPSGDGTAYTADAIYGNGTNTAANEYVVYKGNAAGFTTTGLTNTTQYCLKVFSRCATAWSAGVETCFYPWDYRDTLVVMAYNVLNYSGTNAYSGRWADFRTIVNYVKPDIVLCNEMVNSNGATTLLTNGLNSYGAVNYAQATFINGPDSDNMLYYNTNKIMLATQSQITTALRDISYYQVNWPNVAGGTTTLDLYSLHLKASSGASNENKRLLECQNLRTHMDGTLPAVSNIIVGGDFNFYGAAVEPAWNELTANGTQLLIDPSNRVGAWHDNSTFSDAHTQSTRSNTNPGSAGGSTGGLDDRFDFIFGNKYTLYGGNGVHYIQGTYDEIGNDGNKFNLSIIENLPNTDVPDSVRIALFNMSDHLPVVMQIQIDRLVSLLPVNITNFEAIPNELNQIELSWTTLNEINNDYFLIQRSKDGINYETILTVKGAGNSSSRLNYTEIDLKPYEGLSYYRLIQVDFDGAETISKPIAIHFNANQIDLFLYPNPTNGNIVNVHCENIYEKEIVIQIKNLLGQVVFEKQFHNLYKNFTTQLTLPNNLTDELYIISVNTINRQVNKKLIINH